MSTIARGLISTIENGSEDQRNLLLSLYINRGLENAVFISASKHRGSADPALEISSSGTANLNIKLAIANLLFKFAVPLLLS